jgi:hypothetical protein
MEPEIVKSDYTANTGEAEQQTPALKTEAPSTESPALKIEAPSTESSTERLLLFGYRISELLDDLPNYATYFFGAYKQPLVSIGLILVAFVAVKLMLAVLDAINDIPLVAPTFKLIGLAYTTWFVYRYLIGAANRQELSEAIKTFKEYVLGRGS